MKNKTIIIIVAVILFLVFSIIFPAYTLKAYHSDTTASQKSWTQWPLEIKTNYKYQESAFEAYLKKNLKEPIEYQWVSSRGTQKNIYGSVLVRAHGRPNSLLSHPNDFLKIWIEFTQKEEIIAFYKTLKDGENEEVELAIDQFFAQSEKLLNKNGRSRR